MRFVAGHSQPKSVWRLWPYADMCVRYCHILYSAIDKEFSGGQRVVQGQRNKLCLAGAMTL